MSIFKLVCAVCKITKLCGHELSTSIGGFMAQNWNEDDRNFGTYSFPQKPAEVLLYNQGW